jgi:hypothetical protein
MNKEIKITSIWEDINLLKVNIQGSNGLFSGNADCYTQRREINELGLLCEQFKLSLGNTVSFSTQITEGLSYFSFIIKCIDKTGLINVRTKIEHIMTNENYLVEFDFDVDPISLEDFGKSLRRLSKAEIGMFTAELQGKI